MHGCGEGDANLVTLMTMVNTYQDCSARFRASAHGSQRGLSQRRGLRGRSAWFRFTLEGTDSEIADLVRCGLSHMRA